MRPARSHREDISREIGQNILNLLAGELRSPRPGTENRETGNCVTFDGGSSGPRMTGYKDDLPAFHAGVEGVAGAKSEFSPDRTG